jgi:hypothetical protein
MPDVVRQGQRFGEVFIQAQHSGHGARDLRDLNGVRQPIAEMVGEADGEDLGFIFEPPERACVNDAVAVALKRIPVGVRKLRIAAATTLLHREAEMNQRLRRVHCFYFFLSMLSA